MRDVDVVVVGAGIGGSARENVNPKAGRAARVVTTREWLEEYLSGGSPLFVRQWSGEPENSPLIQERHGASSKGYRQEIAERQAVEILRLQARIAELKQRP